MATVVISLATLEAVPALAAVLADQYEAPPLVGAVVFLTPLWFIRGIVCSEPSSSL